MYLIKLGPIVYGRRDGSAFTLPEALRAVYGVGEATVLREDGTPVVARAGSAYAVTHVPTGREVRRRSVRQH